MWASLAAYSCGGSQGIGDMRRTLFPFHPPMRGGTIGGHLNVMRRQKTARPPRIDPGQPAP